MKNESNVKAWMFERKIDLAMKEVIYDDLDDGEKQTEEEVAHDRELAKKIDIAPFDDKIEVGQIRLLSGALTPQFDYPVHFVVLDTWTKGCYLVASFSPYSSPATMTELLFPDNPPMQRVVSLWNTASVHTQKIQKSWIIGNFSKTELDDLWSIFRHAMTGIEIDTRLMDRVGCNVKSVRDLRIVYMSEQVKLWSTFSPIEF